MKVYRKYFISSVVCIKYDRMITYINGHFPFIFIILYKLQKYLINKIADSLIK
jgi:hypothetical protein